MPKTALQYKQVKDIYYTIYRGPSKSAGGTTGRRMPGRPLKPYAKELKPDPKAGRT